MKTTSFVIWASRRLGHLRARSSPGPFQPPLREGHGDEANPHASSSICCDNAMQSLFQSVASALTNAPLPIMDHFVFSRAPVDSDNAKEVAAVKEVGYLRCPYQ